MGKRGTGLKFLKMRVGKNIKLQGTPEIYNIQAMLDLESGIENL